MRFYPLEKLINLHDDYARQFKIDNLYLLLIQREGERYLLEGRCPHRGHPLDVATFSEGVLECALHHYRFAMADGRLLHATEEPCRGLRSYDVVYQGNELGLMLEEELEQ
ncbi:MAG: Rieske (2Fe-2S) protein [Halieaceae bacterium]|nr:Rieske (2Fe-2S) protein [Halieaceae bacterium]MCP5164186.1 Rieske (2Fe-2S) protein [Pseudomonadales bacterium]MCP5203738.1 Rieske (2Fe-2S) protein [Pseudomonadales bacterium]